MDQGIQDRIKSLIDEEHRLRTAHATRPDDDAPTSSRLGDVETQLDQCWDLLRQRRAKREFDEDPGDAAVRPASIVENYRE